MLILVLVSCKKNTAPDEIVFSSKDIRILAGAQTTVTIEGPVKAYTVASGNEAIGRATIQDNRITITTEMPGATVIRVSDNRGRTAEIRLIARSVSGSWRKIDGARYVTKVTVEAIDAAAAARIRQEMADELAKPANAILGWIFSGEPNMRFKEVHVDNSSREGDFTFSNLVLRLSHAGKEEIYQLTPLDNRVLQVDQDVTQVMKARYPDQGITKVIITRFLQEYLMPG